LELPEGGRALQIRGGGNVILDDTQLEFDDLG
jgi:hypothetical protein